MKKAALTELENRILRDRLGYIEFHYEKGFIQPVMFSFYPSLPFLSRKSIFIKVLYETHLYFQSFSLDIVRFYNKYNCRKRQYDKWDIGEMQQLSQSHNNESAGNNDSHAGKCQQRHSIRLTFQPQLRIQNAFFGTHNINQRYHKQTSNARRNEIRLNSMHIFL